MKALAAAPCAVRPDDRIKARDARAFAITEEACEQVGWVFRRTAGPGPVVAANLRWLATRSK
jgi:hypothetical protein